jgi:deoxyribose-phosphate aldolase
MTNIEFSFYDISHSDEEIKILFNKVKNYDPKVVSVLPSSLKIAKSIFDNSTIACAIDYPFGILDTKNRLSQIETAHKIGANCVNIVAPNNYLCNRKYDKLREDIRLMLNLCSSLNIEIRYILEYRIFSYDLLYKVCQIFKVEGINTIYPATGYGLDDINDNIIAAALINKKVPINIVCNGNIWNKSQIENLNKAKLYGFQFNSVNALGLMHKNQLK